MAVRVYEDNGAVYLTGAGQTPCLRWQRQEGRWLSEPVPLPDSATDLAIADIPDDLREELLAFVVRADAMGAASQAFGN